MNSDMVILREEGIFLRPGVPEIPRGLYLGQLILDTHFVLILGSAVSCALPFLQGSKN